MTVSAWTAYVLFSLAGAGGFCKSWNLCVGLACNGAAVVALTCLLAFNQ